MNTSLDFESFANSLMSNLKVAPPQRVGTVVRVVGMTLEAKGLIAPVGSLCGITSEGHGDFHAEVIGFDNETLYLMPFSEPVGVHPGSHVRLLSTTAKAELGHAQLGRVLDGLGRPLDGKPMPLADRTLGLQGLIINPMERGEITEALDVGIKTINGLLTLGRGQRVGLMAGSGVGKSVLLGMMSKYTEADVVVIGLIGERGREVKDFIEESLGEAEVRATFSVGKGAIAGCYILTGKLQRNCSLRVIRSDKVIFEGNLDSLKRSKDDVKEVNTGFECGVGCDKFSSWIEGDKIEAFKFVTKKRTLTQ